MSERIYSKEFGWIEVRSNADPQLIPAPLPQTGVHAVEVIREQFRFSRERFEAACRTVGVSILPGDLIDMGELLAAIVQNKKASDSDE